MGCIGMGWIGIGSVGIEIGTEVGTEIGTGIGIEIGIGGPNAAGTLMKRELAVCSKESAP